MDHSLFFYSPLFIYAVLLLNSFHNLKNLGNTFIECQPSFALQMLSLLMIEKYESGWKWLLPEKISHQPEH